jgi:CRP/FNR family cyclic AMP-dependent transcriptional regulator
MDVARLNEVPLFAGLSRRERKAIAQHADEIEVPAGTRLVNEGQLAYELFVIVSGTADVLVGEERIAAVGPGDVIGEVGVLETHKRTASVIATSPISAIVVNGPELRAMARDYPDVDAQLRGLIAERQR